MGTIDPQRFQEAYQAVLTSEYSRVGIGMLSEKTMHAVLKRYYEPHSENHEITVGRHVADIVGENGIIEIQTTDFSRLKEKLAAFSEVCSVTVVHPIIRKRRLCWVDRESKTVVESRNAPCKDPRADAFLELLRVREFLNTPNLRFLFPLMEIEEYRYLNPKQKNPHKKASRCDKIPTAILEEWEFSSVDDYRAFLPENLPDQFISRDFAKSANCAFSTAQIMLKLFTELSLVKRVGKQGKSYIYQLHGEEL